MKDRRWIQARAYCHNAGNLVHPGTFRHHGMVKSDIFTVEPSELVTTVSEVLESHGVPGDLARQQATVWMEADAREQPSHGVQRLFTMLGRISNGRVNVRAQPRFDWSAPGVLVVNGDDGLGPPIANEVVERLQTRSREQGITIGVVKRAHHLGMLAPYAEEVANGGFIGIATCTSEALVHPWGGSRPLIGTNPLAIAIPVEGDIPVSLDMSTGSTSRGRILHHAMTGAELQEGWAVDEHGQPTTNPQEALDGAISPFGGAKGYALGIVLEILVASLTGTSWGEQVTGTLDETEAVTKGDVFICIDPRRIAGSTMGDEIAGYLRTVRNSPVAAGSDRIMIPGERAHRVRLRNLTDGVPVERGLWERIRAVHETRATAKEKQ